MDILSSYIAVIPSTPDLWYSFVGVVVGWTLGFVVGLWIGGRHEQ